uniref:Dynein heavy chain protein 2 n=1 Tax=Mycena chlorophos TaxID=658473 RepID=A0ABQ0LUM3_MYCCL|nr:dynein heavy chain protein 2 [Mycena chlorophos]
MVGDADTEVFLSIHPAIDLAVKLARARGTPPSIHAVPPGLLRDAEFLDALETGVESWQQSIGRLVDRPIPPFNALVEEIQGWSTYGSGLEAVFAQLCVRDDILLVAECLQKTRDKMIILDILSNGLRAQLDLVRQYQTLLANIRDQFDELAAVTELDALQPCILRIFNVFQEDLRRYPYPFERAVPLAEEISHVLVERLSQTLRSQSLLDVPFPTLEHIYGRLTKLAKSWESATTGFRNFARQFIRRRGERYLRIALGDGPKMLQLRVWDLLDLRKHDDQVAREMLAEIDLLDVSVDGRVAWRNAMAACRGEVVLLEPVYIEGW